MRNFILKFGSICNRIRFSFPQWPNNEEKPDFYLSDEGKLKAIQNFKKLKKEFPEITIVLLYFDKDGHETDFEYCKAQRFLFVVDHFGEVFPCPQVPTEEYKHLSYGNIKNNSFSEIWNGEKRKKILKMKVCDMNCRICDRKDEEINEFLGDVYES